MKFKNLENDSIIEIDSKDVARIEKLKGYPDKFEMIEEKKIHFSEQAIKDIAEMKAVCGNLLVLLEENPEDVIEWHGKVSAMEQKIDDLTVAYRNSMFERIQKGSCSDEGSILFSEMLTDFERIGDHALNISSEMLAITMAENS